VLAAYGRASVMGLVEDDLGNEVAPGLGRVALHHRPVTPHQIYYYYYYYYDYYDYCYYCYSIYY
jgi:hypothetical protein